MTPQLQQAIKLLQFTNLELATYRGGAGAQPAAGARRTPTNRRPSAPRPSSFPPDRSETPTPPITRAPTPCRIRRHAPLDAEHARDLDPGGVVRRRAHLVQPSRRRRLDFADDERGIDDIAETRRPLHEHLGEQLRLGLQRFRRPPDRRAPDRPAVAGRTADRRPAAIAACHGRAAGTRRGGPCAHDALRPDRPVRARPAGMPGRATGRAQPAGSGDGGAARPSRPAGPPRHAAADEPSAASMPKTLPT